MSISDTIEDDYPIVKGLLIESTKLLVELVINPECCDKDFVDRYESFRLKIDKYNEIVPE